MGQLWKGRAQNREALGAGFSSLLLRVPFCLCHMQSAVCKGKVLNRYGIDIILSCLGSVLDCLNFWKLLSHHHFSPLFFLVSLFQLYEPDGSHFTSCAGHHFVIYVAFLKTAVANVCLSLLIWSFWHVKCLIRPHSSFFGSFFFPQLAYFTWQGEFPAVSWLDTPTLSFSCL